MIATIMSSSSLSSPLSTRTAIGPVGLVLAAAMLWGTTGTAQHFAPAQFSPYWVGALRMVMAALFFVALAFVMDRGHARQPMHHGRILFCGACMAVYNLSFFAGVKASGVALGTALAIGSGPIWAGLMQALVLRAPLSALWWAGTLVSVAGGAAMVMARGGATLSWSGLALCLLAGLSYAGYALINKRLVTHMSPRVVNFYVFTGAACMAVPIALVQSGLPQWSLAAVLVVVYLGVVVSGLAHMLFSIGLRSISGPTGVTLSLIEPVAAFVLAVWVVGERQPLQSWLGLLAVLAGLMLVIGAEMRSQRAVMAAQMA